MIQHYLCNLCNVPRFFVSHPLMNVLNAHQVAVMLQTKLICLQPWLCISWKEVTFVLILPPAWLALAMSWKYWKLACEAAHFQPHRYNMLLFGFDVILLMGENDLFTMISLCIVWCLDIYITSPLQVNFYNGFYYRDCDYFAGLISTQLPQLMSWTLNAHQS